MYDDAVELEQYFVAERDKLCKEGERFISPALLTVTRRHLQQELDEERKSKAEADSREDAQLTEAGSREGTAPEVRKRLILGARTPIPQGAEEFFRLFVM